MARNFIKTAKTAAQRANSTFVPTSRTHFVNMDAITLMHCKENTVQLLERVFATGPSQYTVNRRHELLFGSEADAAEWMKRAVTTIPPQVVAEQHRVVTYI